MQGVQKLDSRVALAGIKASRIWTPPDRPEQLKRPEHPYRPELTKRPESGRFTISLYRPYRCIALKM